MVNNADRIRKPGLYLFTATRRVGAINKNRRPTFRADYRLVGALKSDSSGKKLQSTRHRVSVDAHDFVPESAQSVRQRHLRSDAIAVGSRMADDGDGAVCYHRSQTGKLRGKSWKILLHLKGPREDSAL